MLFIAPNSNSSHSYGASPAIWDHSVTWHPTRHWSTLTQPDRPVLDLPIPEGWKAELTLDEGASGLVVSVDS